MARRRGSLGLVALALLLLASTAYAQAPIQSINQFKQTICVNAGDSIRKNAAGTAFECYTPATGTGDITQVWSVTTGDVSAMTAASGDTLDAKSADSTAPAKSGTSPPATCTEGDLFFDTNATDGENLICCAATDTWVTCGDGGGGSGDITAVGNCSTGDAFTGSCGSSITSTTGESINMAFDSFFLFTRNDAGAVTIGGADNSSPADTIYDTAGAGAITVGSADVTSVTVVTDGTGTAEFVVPNDSIALTTETSGNYVATLACTSPLSGCPAAGEGATGTIAIGDVTDCTAGQFVTGISANLTLVCDTPSGSGSMDDFLVDADTGTAETIADGNTLQILGGTGIDTAVSATDTITVTLNAGIADLNASSSADLAGVLTDENGIGEALFNGATNPTFTTSATVPLIYGGTNSGDDLSLQSTSASATGTIILEPELAGDTLTAAKQVLLYDSDITFDTGGGGFNLLEFDATISANDEIPTIYMLDVGGTIDFDGLTGTVGIYTMSAVNIEWILTSDDWIRYQDGIIDRTQIIKTGATDKTTIEENDWYPYSFVSVTQTSTTGAGDYRIAEQAALRHRPLFDSANTASTLDIDLLAAVVSTAPEAISGNTCSDPDSGGGGCNIDEYVGLLVDFTHEDADVVQTGLDTFMTIGTFYGVKLDDIVAGNGTITNKRSLWSEATDAHMIHAGFVGVGDGTDVPTHTMEVGGGQGNITSETAILTDGTPSYNVTGTISARWISSDAAITTGNADSFLGTWSAFRRGGSFTTNSTTETNPIARYLFLDQDTITTSVDEGPAIAYTVGAFPTISSSAARTNANFSGGMLVFPTLSAVGAITFTQTEYNAFEVRPHLVTNNASGNMTVSTYRGLYVKNNNTSTGAGTEAITNMIGVDIASMTTAVYGLTAGIRNADATVYSPTTLGISGGFTISPSNKTIYRLTGDADPVTSSAAVISDGEFDGQMLFILNSDGDDDNIVLDCVSASTNLDCVADCNMNPGGTALIIWDATLGNWALVSCSANTA